MVTKLEPLFNFDTTKTFVKPGKTTSLVFRTKMHEEELRDLVDNARRHGGSYEVMHEALNGKKVWVKLADRTYHLAKVRGGYGYGCYDEEEYGSFVYVEYANEDEATMIGEKYFGIIYCKVKRPPLSKKEQENYIPVYGRNMVFD